MDISRLKSLRAGNKAAVTKVFNKLEDAIVDTPLDPEEICTLLEAIEKKKKTLANIDEQILNTVDSEGITDEIIETDEYYLELESKIRKYKKFLKPVATATSSILDSNAQEFIPNSHSNPFTHSSRELSQTSSTSSQNHRLPKLTLPNFSGDILEWQFFWDSFESTIHHNSTLSDIQKFSYLKSLLQSDAANVVSGLTMTNPNYYKAIELLTNRYGQTHKIINAYMRSLLDMPVPDERLESLRAFYDKSEAYIRGLESLGQCQEMFGSLLIPVILGKLPPDFRKNITRENGSDDWNIQKLRDAICRELSIQESGHNEYMYQPPTANHTANFVASVKKDFSKQGKTSKSQGMKKTINSAQRKRACTFCEGDHFSNDYTDVAEHERRIVIIKEKKLCFNCFGTHKVSDCRSKYDCRICHRKHHTSICKKNTTQQSEDKDTTETSMLYTSASQETSTVLLKTAVAQVMSVNNTAEANILFDEGAQRSFITADIATKLNVQKEGSENLNIVSFGNKTSGIRNLDKTTVQLKANNGEIIPLKVLIVPSIASPLQSQSRKITQGLHYLHGLSLAHPVTDAESFELTLLIGADFYWNIVQDKVIRGNGPTAVSSKLGYLLSGPIPVKNNNQSTSMMNVLISHKQETCDLEKFWKLESLGIDEKEVDTQLIDVMETFAESSITKQNGKYVSKLPWKENCPELPTNKEIVKRRTENLIRRISKDKEMFRMYGDIISDQERRGFIEEVSDETLTENRIHYIPHHAVKKYSTTTPIRIVYNCSCKANSYSASLNDCLAEYPPMMNDLTTIWTRFRMEKYAVTADIEKAFLHIELDENDRDVTRFFWLQNPNNPNSPLITYRFKVVLFGATCSPFILSATLMKHFKENPSNTSSELLKNIYVDNILTSFPDEPSLLKFYT
ncbi:uncharacterized protein LOC134694475 [Mytilus trossulus]|uniref:uncharacterized protein LOC134694475 n=1 Tax=Mytilus trossulus TaxID=6551 RepID=UPI0030068A94